MQHAYGGINVSMHHTLENKCCNVLWFSGDLISPHVACGISVTYITCWLRQRPIPQFVDLLKNRREKLMWDDVSLYLQATWPRYSQFVELRNRSSDDSISFWIVLAPRHDIDKRRKKIRLDSRATVISRLGTRQHVQTLSWGSDAISMANSLCTKISQAEAQKPKTFRVVTFYAQKLSGRSARNRFSRQT